VLLVLTFDAVFSHLWLTNDCTVNKVNEKQEMSLKTNGARLKKEENITQG